MPTEPPDPAAPSTTSGPAGKPTATPAPAVPATSPGELGGTQALGRLMDAWRARHSKPPAVLYHYTTAQGLHGILTSGRVWATNVGFLNDPSEMRYAARLLRDVIKEESGKFKAAQPAARPQAGFWRALADGYLGTLAGGMTTWTESLLKTFEDQGDAYMACFCTKGDLLSQWRGYGAIGGGYALGFHARQIGSPNTGGSLLRRVIYRPRDQKEIIRGWISAFLSVGSSLPKAAPEEPRDTTSPRPGGLGALFAEWGRVMGAEMKRVATGKQVLEQAQQVLTTFLAECLICFKDPAYAEEQEWRLILLGRNAPEIKFRPSGARLVPYVELALAPADAGQGTRLPLKSITYGPTHEPMVTEKSLVMLRKHYQYERPPVEIKRSGIPFRT